MDSTTEYFKIPTWDNGIDTYSEFHSRKEFAEFLQSIFKEPGKYEFDESSAEFNKVGEYFNKNGFYCEHVEGSIDFINFWDREKEKCSIGYIVKYKNKAWYLAREYYMWLNFLPIRNKEKGNKLTFASIRDAQYHIALYEIRAEIEYKNASILKKRQIASQQPHSEPVLGEHGWTTMGDIQPGDKLWNPDGTLQTILHKSNNGVSDVYEFEFADGRKTRCGIEHNWEVVDRVTKKTLVLNTKQLIEKGIHKKFGSVNHYRFAIKNTKAIEYLNSQSLPIDPYVLGCILGDGSISSSVYISGKDEEIFDEISSILGDEYELNDIGYCKRGIVYKDRFGKNDQYENSRYGVNPILRELAILGLRVNNKGVKHIPDIYLHSSIKDRISLIQGLMDTDGFVNASGNNIHFTNKNKNLIDGLAYICRSLGIRVTVSEKNNKHGVFYRLLFSGNIPYDIFRLTRKKIRFNLRKQKKTFDVVPLISITKLDYQEESSCIIVDNPNHLYITNDFIVTHNSFFHTAKITNKVWFDEGAITMMGASSKEYVLKSWNFMEEYRSFLNTHTAWYRPMNPGKPLDWEQKIEQESGGRKSSVGLKSTARGVTFEKSPTAGVGGPTQLFFYEEAGIAKTMDQTYEYMRPAMQSGQITTGIFICAGSVGDLKECEPLKDFTLNPDKNGFLAVESNLADENWTHCKTALFVPEQWSMMPYIDQYGNSQVEEAVEAILKEREIWKNGDKENNIDPLDPNIYQLRVSQKPINIKEAFDFRDESVFKMNLINGQRKRIEDKEYPIEYVELEEEANGEITIKKTSKTPIKDFPIKKNEPDKTGVIVIHERPPKNPKWDRYYASIDPVSEGKVSTSESLCSIYIYKNSAEIVRTENNITTSTFEEGKIVAWWCGRFDDINDTHKRLELMIRLYNARTLCESNVSLFIRHMIQEKQQKYLVRKNEILFLKEAAANTNVYQEYGWRNTGTLFTNHMLSYLIEYTQEVIDIETKEDGTVIKKHYGIERIPDIMAIQEMSQYRKGLNVDRLVALAALISFVKLNDTARGQRVVKEQNSNSLDNRENLYKLNNSPFRNIGNKYNKGRNPFKRIR